MLVNSTKDIGKVGDHKDFGFGFYRIQSVGLVGGIFQYRLIEVKEMPVEEEAPAEEAKAEQPQVTPEQVQAVLEQMNQTQAEAE